MGRNGFFAITALALAWSLAGAPPAQAAELKILAPPDGVTFDSTPATLIGSGSSGTLAVTLNGRKVAGVKQSGRAFTALLELSEGNNVLLVTSGEESVQSAFEYRSKGAGTGGYRYHDPVADGECKACHPQGVGRTSPVSDARLCNSCHDPKTGYKYLHGPLGAEQCSVCHDPHGSANPGFLVTELRTLCARCHDQNRSRSHIEKSAHKQCPECHSPHGSDKQFLLY